MRIMTSNIWGDYFHNPVAEREKLISEVFKSYSPDVLGLQEVTPGWYQSELFVKLAEGYAFVGTELYNNGNYVPLVYNKDFELIAKGYERLADTPDKSKAITWAVLQTQEKKIFAVCNTHFWWKRGPEHDRLRVENARQLTTLMRSLHNKYKCPVFAFGDMNTVLSSEVFGCFENSGIKNMYDLAEHRDNICSHHGDPMADENGRFHGKKTCKDRSFSIDHMVGLGEGFQITDYRVVEEQSALDASDHSPVYIDVMLA